MNAPLDGCRDTGPTRVRALSAPICLKHHPFAYSQTSIGDHTPKWVCLGTRVTADEVA